MPSTAIGDALFTKTQQRVLALLYGKPARSIYTNEIMHWADMGRGTIRRELERLISADLLVTSRVGNQLHYQANPDNPVYSELASIVRKTFGIADVLRFALEPVLNSVEFAFIYGSIAKGTDKAKSDIDLMLVGNDLSYADVMELLIPAEDKLRRSINPSIYTVSQIKSKLQDKNTFMIRVMEQPKIWIKGSEDDLREVR